MHSLLVLYSALAVFGVGVTLIDLFGVFDHASGHGHDDASSDSGHGDGGHDAVDDDSAGGDDAGDAHADDASDSSADSGGHDMVHTGGHDSSHDQHAVATHGGSYVASAESGTRAVAKALGFLRSAVYFSLGAGLTGLFSILTKVPVLSGLLWSSGAGLFIAILAKSLRTFIRKDLDSTLKPEEFIMDEAVVCVPIAAGAMGKVRVRRYGRELDLYAKAKDPLVHLAKGSRVRIVDMDADTCWVEALD